MSGLLSSLQGALSGENFQSYEEIPKFVSLTQAMTTVDSMDHNVVRAGHFPVHVSTAIKFCPRQHFIMGTFNREYTTSVTSADRIMWAIGKATEAHNRQTLIKAFHPYNVYGRWSCQCGYTGQYGLGRNPFGVRCQRCQTNILYQYHELPLKYDDLLIGNPDLLIRLGPEKKLAVVEFKSIKADDFKKLTGPTVYHKLQPYFYLKLLEHNKDKFLEAGVEVDLDRFFVIYTSKGYQYHGSIHKEYEVSVASMPNNQRELFDVTIQELKRVKTAIEIPAREVCESATCARAKICPVVGECFSV